MKEEYVEERIKQYSENRSLYDEFSRQVLSILRAIIEQECPDIKLASFSQRAKEIESLRRKLQKDKYNKDSEITDLAGVRVITYTGKDISAIADIISKNFNIDISNSVDKTQCLGDDRVGYRGIHFVVSFDDARMQMPENRKFGDLKCEIQVTSLIAHTWSEITHEKGYKFEGTLPRELERRKNLLAGVLEIADDEIDAYIDSFDRYVAQMEEEAEQGCLNYQINSLSLEKFMAWKFSGISPQMFRDIDMILQELSLFGLRTIQELNDRILPDFEEQVRKGGWRSLDGIIRNILIISDSEAYFTKVWNPSMNQMNRKNYNLYEAFGINIEEICKHNHIHVV